MYFDITFKGPDGGSSTIIEATDTQDLGTRIAEELTAQHLLETDGIVEPFTSLTITRTG